jgi:phosphoribosylaminoimidazole-succinocarboxamide synthase
MPTHFVKQLSDRETLVKAVEILPLEVIVRNVAAGHFSQRYGTPEGTPLKMATLEFSYKRDDLGDPLLNDDHAIALGLATEREIETIKGYASKIHGIMTDFFLGRGLRLVDFKLEFGKLRDGRVVLADEISPDTCRLWDIETNEKMDKDRFRRDLGKVEEAYREVLDRVRERG